MKLQHLAIIFVIIIVPISMAMSQYVQTQIKTIELQSAYKANLDDATHSALMAFQVNAANNKYSSISDSKIRDVEASINTFYNTLGTSMQSYIRSRETLASFIPAILFTLYDGYYIYSSYENVYSLKGEDENKKVEIKSTKNYLDGLRPYIYYSCKYKLSNGNIVVVNYTLDNAITVYGNIDGSGYKARSGYLINTNNMFFQTSSKTVTYGSGAEQVVIEPEELTEHLIIIEEDGFTVSEGDYPYIIYKNQKVYYDKETEDYFWYVNNKKSFLQSENANLQRYIEQNGVGFKSISAYEYYKEAYDFSQWIKTNLKDLKQSDAIRMEEGDTPIGSNTSYLSVNTGNERIFNVSDTNDPMKADSTFNSHRIAIIRKSIETNLNAAFANYSKQGVSNYEFQLPVIDEERWYNIANNVSIISFMQGIPIGMKYFNNYSVITNTKNKEVVNAQSLYVLAKDKTNGAIEYHQPGCKTLIDNVKDGKVEIIGAYNSLSFLRQTVKISEANLRYFYPQARVGTTTTGCYNCIVNAAADYDIDSIIDGEIKEIRKTYLTALARERYDLYKSNFDL